MVMAALAWMLSWLPLVLPAMSELPRPVNVTLTTNHFSHILRWEPGPGTPIGAFYHVSITTERGSSWMPVAGCEHVQQPLVCNLTEAFSDPLKTYITMVKAHNSSLSAIISGYEPIMHLGLPLLTVRSCGRDLCVDLQPPKEHLREAYDKLDYQFQIRSNNGDGAQFVKDISSLRTEILKDLAPGRQYCVSVRFSNRLEANKSHFSQPVCAVTPGIFSTDPLISALLCLLVIVGVVVIALLVCTGFICLKRRPEPSVLASIHHKENVLVVAPLSTPLSSLLKIWPTMPSADEKRSSLSLSDESEEQSATEGTDGSTGGGYKLRPGANLLSSSSSASSSLSVPLSLESEPPPSLSSKQPLDFNSQLKDQIPADTYSSAGQKHSLITGTDNLTGEETDSKKTEYKVGEGDSQNVNLLTLTFGRHEEDKEEEENSQHSMPKVELECQCSSEECSSTSVLLSQTSSSKEVATETVFWCVDEEEEEEEIDKYSGYMGRTCTHV